MIEITVDTLWDCIQAARMQERYWKLRRRQMTEGAGEFNLSNDVPNFSSFGVRWCELENNGTYEMPSFQTIVMGLYEHHCELIDADLYQMPPKWIKQYKQKEKKLFNYFIFCLGTEES